MRWTRRWLIVALAVIGSISLSGGVATTEAAARVQRTPVVACNVDPVEILNRATPSASASASVTIAPQAGPVASPETIAELQQTLDELRACAATGDLARVAALFTPAGFASAVLAEEPVAIEPIPAGATPAADGTTALPTIVEPGSIARGVVREDGSVEAYLDVGTRSPRVVVFVRADDGRWVIDAIAPSPAPPDAEATPARPIGAEEIPGEVWEAIVATLGLTDDATIVVRELEAIDWPDSSLGCPADGSFAAQVVTPGYRLVVEVAGERTELHTDLAGNAVTCPA